VLTYAGIVCGIAGVGEYNERCLESPQLQVSKNSHVTSYTKLIITTDCLLWKLNQTQSTKIYLDVSVSIRGFRQKKMKLILLPVLPTVVMWHGKKSVVRVAQCVAALIPVHRTSSLLSNVHRLFDPSGTSVRLSIQNCSLWSVNRMIVPTGMVSQGRLVLFWQTV